MKSQPLFLKVNGMEDNSNFNIAIGTVIIEGFGIFEFFPKGGMGEVYRAPHINLKGEVAI